MTPAFNSISWQLRYKPDPDHKFHAALTSRVNDYIK